MGPRGEVWVPIGKAAALTGYSRADLCELAEAEWVPTQQREGRLLFHREFLQYHVRGWIGIREAEESEPIGYSSSYLSRLAKWRWVAARQVTVGKRRNWLFFREMLEARRDGWVASREANDVTGYSMGHLRWMARSGRLNAYKLQVDDGRGEIWLFFRDDLPRG